jgi:hypothetical protein
MKTPKAARWTGEDDTETWKAIARESLRAFDHIFMPAVYGKTPQESGRIALEHLRTGRALLQQLVDGYVAAARTRPGRARRRRRAGRGVYVYAFDQALAHATARAAGTEEPRWPLLYTRGSLPLLDRYTVDRRVLGDAAPVEPGSDGGLVSAAAARSGRLSSPWRWRAGPGQG